MSQTLYTKYFGPIEVEMSWQNNIMHIVKLVDNKGYLHATGIPINNKDEITECIPAGIHRDAALRWFEQKDDLPEKPRKEVTFRDNGFQFSDGSPINSVSDLVENLPAGPVLDAAYEWFKAEKAVKQEEEIKAQSPTGRAMKSVVKKAVEQDEGQ